MAITFTGAGVASDTVATGGGQSGFTVTQPLAVGDYLVILLAYDNSGGGGSDPASGGLLNWVATGIGSPVSSQSGLNDPGAASAGLAVKCAVFPITAAISTNTVGTVTWGGSSIATRAIAAIKVSSSLGAGASIAYRTRNAATGANGVAVTTVAHTTPSVTSGEGVLCWAGHENGAAITGDADTTNGSWSAVYGTFIGTGLTGMAAYFQSKVVTATATQSFDPTGASSDWIVGSLIFTETVLPTISQTAYRVYAQGTEAGSTALATQDTAYSPNVISDLNLQLRVRLQETGAAAVTLPSDCELQYAKNGGAWTDVYSDPYLLTSYPFAEWSNWLEVINASGQSFTGNGEKLARMAFDINRTGSPPGTYSAALYAHSGTFGTSSVGTGAALKTSTTVINGTSIPTGFGWVFFEFDGAYTLVNGTNYVMAITRSTAGDASNRVSMVYDINAPSRPGNRCDYNGSSWSAQSGYDYMTRVYTVPTTPPTNVVGQNNTALWDSTTEAPEGTPTTNRLTGGSGSFSGAGTVGQTGLCEGINPAINTHVELLYAITLKSANLANGDTLTFRVIRNNQPLNTYSVTPTLNVTKAVPAITQAAYRFYDDTGTEATSPPLAAQDTAVTGNLATGDGTGQFRVRLQSTTAVDVLATDDFRLEWEKNASGTWNTVPSGAVIGYDSPTLTEAGATTSRLTGGSGSFTAGKIAEDGVVDNLGWTGNNFTELVFSVKLVAAQLANGDTIRFRVVKNGATTDMTYSVTPTIDIAIPPSTWTGSAGGVGIAGTSGSFSETVVPVGGKPKVWSGSAWVEKPIKVWTGSAWVEKPLKVWTGSEWVLA